MKQTYVERTPILTLLTFFALVLGSQWTFGQAILSESWDTDTTGDWTQKNGSLTYSIANENVTFTPNNGANAHFRKQTNTGAGENGKDYVVYLDVTCTNNDGELKIQYNAGAVYGETPLTATTTLQTHRVLWNDMVFNNGNSANFRIYETNGNFNYTFDNIYIIRALSYSNLSTVNNAGSINFSIDFADGATNHENDAYTYKLFEDDTDSNITLTHDIDPKDNASGSITATGLKADTSYTFKAFNNGYEIYSEDFTSASDTNSDFAFSTESISYNACSSAADDTITLSIPYTGATFEQTYTIVATYSDNTTFEGTVKVNDVETNDILGDDGEDGTVIIENVLENKTVNIITTGGDVNENQDYAISSCKNLAWNYSDNTTWDKDDNWLFKDNDDNNITNNVTARHPNSGDDVTISAVNNDNVPSINVDVVVKNATFTNKLSVVGSGSLTCENLTLNNGYNEVVTTNNSTNLNSGTLIVNGTFNTNGNNIAYLRYVADTKNDLIASPFDNESYYEFINDALTNNIIDGSGTDTGVATYNNNSKEYSVFDKTTSSEDKFELGKGYAIGVNHDGSKKKVRFNSNYTNTDESSFASNSSNTLVTLKRELTINNPWNLIGNPYLAYYNLSQFLTDNATSIDDAYQAIYGYDDGTFVTYNNTNASTRNIAPSSAFFVAAISNGVTVSFNPAQRKTASVLSNNDDFNTNRVNNTVERFDLVISDGDKSFKTNFYFDNNVTAGLDRGYDAGSFNAKSQDLAIYSLLADNSSELDLSIQALPLDKLENQEVKLGVNAKAGNNYSISLENNSFENQSIFITDRVTNQVFDLTKGAYNFSVNTDLEGTERFEISFQSDALSQQESLLNQLQVVTHNHTITVIGNIESNTSLKVYDLQGRVIAQKVVSNDSREISLDNQNTGVYVVSISNTNGQRTQKVILK